MDMPVNKFKHALARGEKLMGMWLSMSNHVSSEVFLRAGYDWVMLDMEHSPNDYLSILSQLQIFEASDTTALVRVEWNDAVAVKRVLDMGAPGILFPMIETVDEAKAAVAATRYPPNGNRGFAGSSRATQFGRHKDYFKRVEQETSVLLQIETTSALEQAEAIADVEGVDGLFFGPGDISADMGLLGQPNHPDVWAAIKPVADRLIAKGIPVGTLMLDTDFAIQLFDEGYGFVACGTDTSLLASAADALVAAVKSKT